MQNVSERYQTSAHPIRILQFGEGNFLRAFADYAIDAQYLYGMPAGTAGWGSVYGKPGHYFGSDRTQRPR